MKNLKKKEMKEKVQGYINICEEIIQDFDNDWCFNTIEGIKNWIIEHNHITEKQIEAINNIKSKIEEKNHE